MKLIFEPTSGLRYVSRRDAEGRRYRDFTVGGQIDDRFDVDDRGEIVQVRDKASPQILDLGDEDGDDAEPASELNGHAPVGRTTLDIGQGPPDAFHVRRTLSLKRRPSLDSLLRAARKYGASAVRVGDYEIVLDPLTGETGGNDIDRLLANRKKRPHDKTKP